MGAPAGDLFRAFAAISKATKKCARLNSSKLSQSWFQLAVPTEPQPLDDPDLRVIPHSVGSTFFRLQMRTKFTPKVKRGSFDIVQNKISVHIIILRLIFEVWTCVGYQDFTVVSWAK